jgi:hypothetical protein
MMNTSQFISSVGGAGAPEENEGFCRRVQTNFVAFPKRWSTTAFQDASPRATIIGSRASVLECAGAPALFHRRAILDDLPFLGYLLLNPSAANQTEGNEGNEVSF